MNSRILLEKKQLDITLDRLCYELIERLGDFKDIALIGMQPRGIYLSRRIKEKLCTILGKQPFDYGELDISFYRDDFRRGHDQIVPSELKIDFTIQDKKIVLIDDVLYTGRSIRSALDALTDFGRPAKVELLVLVDRKYSRDLPIQPNYVGIKVDTRANDKVKVDWKENGKKDAVHIVTSE
ncbi:MAG: bifunctional pyr operon transcriptional regulator/uracil phosphoribosyltransferase [Bacteroidetes bacterium B1(2017)]|nr:MAG: bifunctional pyr operon transcriptional regulator/uracil phosphoribosyltransferase [Bacteroidetes bacterium B1(2017)]